MSKKILSIVLSVVMLMSVLVIGASAAITNYENAVKWTLICGSLGNTVPSDAKLAEIVTGFEALDPDVFERNLAFWDDSIIDAYHNASSNADWQALYNDMRGSWVLDSEGEPLEDFYPAKVKTGKAKIDIKYETDVAYAKPGDEITVTLSARTNFYFFELQAGVIYDKTKVEYVVGSSTVVPCEGWTQSGSENPNFGFVGTKDNRSFAWPAAYRENKNGEYDKYAMVNRASIFDFDMYIAGEAPCARILPDFTPMFTFKFVVKDGVADGDTLDFFSIDGTYRTVEELLFYEDIGTCPVLNEADRVISPIHAGENFRLSKLPYETSGYDHDWTFYNASVTVGEAPADPDPADYTALDNAISDYDALVADAADYTAATWADYAAAANAGKAVDRDLTVEDQAIVDNAASAITDAKAALAKNTVVSAEVVGSAVIGSNATVNVVVEGKPSYIRLVNGGNSLNFTAENAVVVNNADGTQTWTIKPYVSAEQTTYDVYAMYANMTEEGVALVIEATTGLDLSIHSIEIPDMYPNGVNGGTVTKGKHTIIVKTSTDVCKIQFVDTRGKIEDGCTYTYSPSNAAKNCSYVDNENGERVWTITHAFGPMGEWSMPIRTRAESTTFATTGDSLVARVVY